MLSNGKDLFIMRLVILFLLFLPKEDQIPTQMKLFSLPSEELSSRKPLGTSHQPTSQAADGTFHGMHSGACSPQTHTPGNTASHTVSHSITSTVWKPVPSMMAHGRLLSSPGRSEVGSGEELLSEASDASLNGNP